MESTNNIRNISDKLNIANPDEGASAETSRVLLGDATDRSKHDPELKQEKSKIQKVTFADEKIEDEGEKKENKEKRLERDKRSIDN
jgi:hypothetical protein